MPLMDNLTRFSNSEPDQISMFDPALIMEQSDINLYYEIFVTDYEDILRKQVELDQAQAEWDSLVLLHETVTAVYGHVSESKIVTPGIITYCKDMHFLEHDSFAGLENLHDPAVFQIGCENLISTIWENIKRFFKWLWEKIKGFFKAIKNFFMKVLAFFGLVDDKPTKAGTTIEETAKAIDDVIQGDIRITGSNTNPRVEIIPIPSPGKESQNNIYDNSTTDKCRKEVTSILIRTLSTKFETINTDKMIKLVEIIASNMIPMVKTFLSAKDVPEMDDIRRQVSNKILGAIPNTDRELQDIAVELLGKGSIRLDNQNVDTLLRENSGEYAGGGVTTISRFYEILVKVCIETMDDADSYLQRVDNFLGGITKEINNISDKDDKIDSKLKFEPGFKSNVILYMKKITEPAAIAITKGFSTKIVILSQVMRTFYREMIKFTPLVKLNMDHHYDQYFTNSEKAMDLWGKFKEHYEGMNVHVDAMGKHINLGELNLGINTIEPFESKLVIIVTPLFDRMCNDESIRYWMYAHEVGHVMIKSSITSKALDVRKYDKKRSPDLKIKTLSTLKSYKNEYACDKYAFDKYGEAVSVQALEWFGNAQAKLSNGKYSFNDVMDGKHVSGNRTHPTLNERIAKIKSYSKI